MKMINIECPLTILEDYKNTQESEIAKEIIGRCMSKLQLRGFIKASPDELAIMPLPSITTTVKFANGSRIVLDNKNQGDEKLTTL